MRHLSISRAWEETTSAVRRDGRLFASVALALIVLPAAIVGAFYPGGLGAVIYAALSTNSLGLSVLVFAVFLVILCGQLAITRLAIGPSITVGGAISHAARRLPTYVAVALIIGLALMLVILIGATLLAASIGAPVSEEQLAGSPLVAVFVIITVAAYFFLLTRVISLAAAVTTHERTGPLQIVRRSWALTSGHFWRIFGFNIAFMLGTSLAVFAVISVVGLGAQALLGKMEPMSASALVMSLTAALLNGVVIAVFAIMLARIYVQLAAPDSVSVPSSGA